MNKKALAILIIASLGFFVAVLLFYSHVGSRQPGPDSPYLGHNAMLTFNAYYEAESQLLYLDSAAIMSWEKSDKTLDNFKLKLDEYLTNFSKLHNIDLSVDDYEFIVKDGYIKAITSKELTITSKFYTYTFKPNFKVKAAGLPASGPIQEETVSLISE